MNKVSTFLKGKKTHLAALAAIVYVVGGEFGWWEVDTEIAAGIIAAGLAFLRMGVRKAEEAAKS